MIPETYIYTVVLLIKGLAQLLELYPKLSSMWNDRSYNLDHSNHVHFLGGKNEEVLIEHQESSMFSLGIIIIY